MTNLRYVLTMASMCALSTSCAAQETDQATVPHPQTYSVSYIGNDTGAPDSSGKLATEQQIEVCGRIGDAQVSAGSANGEFAVARFYDQETQMAAYKFCKGGTMSPIQFTNDVGRLTGSAFTTNKGGLFMVTYHNNTFKTLEIATGELIEGQLMDISADGSFQLLAKIDEDRGREYPFVRTLNNDGSYLVFDISLSDDQGRQSFVSNCMNDNGMVLGQSYVRDENGVSLDDRRRTKLAIWTAETGHVLLEDISTPGTLPPGYYEQLDFEKVRTSRRFCTLDNDGSIVARDHETRAYLSFKPIR